MAKYYGKIGFASTIEVAPGVHEETIVERQYRGDILQNSRRIQERDDIVPDMQVTNRISVVMDPFVQTHFFAIRYIWWAGVRWTVSEATVEYPRLHLRLGGVYNGPTS